MNHTFPHTVGTQTTKRAKNKKEALQGYYYIPLCQKKNRVNTKPKRKEKHKTRETKTKDKRTHTITAEQTSEPHRHKRGEAT